MKVERDFIEISLLHKWLYCSCNFLVMLQFYFNGLYLMIAIFIQGQILHSHVHANVLFFYNSAPGFPLNLVDKGTFRMVLCLV